MNPAETAVLLRQFNEWRRGDEDIPQFDPREIGEAIDAAVEMIDRLEAAEAEAIEQARLNGMGSEREAALMAKLEVAEKERDAAELMSIALRAKVEAMGRQEPVAIQHRVPSVDFRGECVGYSEWRDGKGLEHWPSRTLYAIPGAKGEEK